MLLQPVLDPSGPTLLTSRQSATEPPNLSRVTRDERVALSHLDSPYPELRAVTRQLVRYAREDGVQLSATLYLPAERRSDQPLPTLLWIYPGEFDDPELAGQLDVKPFRYHHVRGASPLAVVLAGYGLMLHPTMPIVGDAEEPSDESLPQLAANAQAAVEFLIDNGIAEHGRIAVGGHSYGAFSATNLLIHTDLFRTALAFSGAYNRTLTQFGFQHEKRTFWDETGLYSLRHELLRFTLWSPTSLLRKTSVIDRCHGLLSSVSS